MEQKNLDHFSGNSLDNCNHPGNKRSKTMRINQLVDGRLYAIVGYDGFLHVYTILAGELYFLSDYGKLWVKDQSPYNVVIYKEFCEVQAKEVTKYYPEYKHKYVDKEYQAEYFKKLGKELNKK